MIGQPQCGHKADINLPPHRRTNSRIIIALLKNEKLKNFFKRQNQEKYLEDIGISANVQTLREIERMVKGWKDELALHNLQSKPLSMNVHSRYRMSSQNSAIKY